MPTAERSSDGQGYQLVGEDNGILERLRIRTSLDDVRSLYFWRAAVAELLGTLLLVLIGCGSCLTSGTDDATVVRIALAFGLGVATIVWGIAHISGGHINPAVTLAMLVTRHISLVRGFVYLVAQLGGAAAGAGILYGLTTKRHTLGATLVPKDGPSLIQAVGIELMITFVLVFVVFATVDSKRDDLNGSGPLAIGLSVTLCHLAFVPLTGSSMNPARSFGPAVVMNLTTNHWVYWVGPLLGGLLAGLIYESMFASNASIDRAKALLLASKYDGGQFVAMRNADKIGIVEKEKGEKQDETVIELKESGDK